MKAREESQNQMAFFRWVAFAKAQYLELNYIFAVPNGGNRDAITGAVLKKEGVRRGVPDIVLPVARHGFNHLYIELKAKGGKLSKEQVEYGNFLTENGSLFVVCVGWESAKDQIMSYLK